MKEQEIKEAAEKYTENFALSVKSAREFGFIDGVKHQQEERYSEEELRNLVKIIEWYDENSDVRPNYTPDVDERIGNISMWDWFEQFKKK